MPERRRDGGLNRGRCDTAAYKTKKREGKQKKREGKREPDTEQGNNETIDKKKKWRDN